MQSILAKTSLFLILSFVSVFVYAETKEIPTDQQYEAEAKKRLEGIDKHDGIDENEAQVIFELYGYRFFSNNGWGPILDGGDVWLGTVLTHWGDQPMPDKVVIDKRTGAVFWALGPKVVDYMTILDIQPNKSLKSGTPQSGAP